MTGFLDFVLYMIKSPWVFLVVSRPIVAYGAGFTSPNSTQRFAVLVLLCLYTWITLADFTTYIQSTGYWASIIAGTIFGLPLLYIDRLIHRRWAFEDRQAIFSTTFPQSEERSVRKKEQKPVKPSHSLNAADTVGSRFAFGNEVSGTVRGPGTSWEVKGLPQFSSSDPRWTPSPTLFMAWKVATLLGCFFLHDYVLDTKGALKKDLLQSSRIPFLSRIGDVTREEVWVRLVVGIASWAAAYCLLQVMFGIPAIIGVLLNPKSVHEWRPVFGPISKMYTIRGFWAKFWHQNLQLNCTGPARIITYDVLRLPRTGLIQRYTLIFFVFSMSGCLHLVTDMAATIPLRDSGALRFFCTQTLGIMLEDGAQEVYRRFVGKPGLTSRIVGYLWVVAFLSWSTAVWQYPAILVTKKEDVAFRLSSLRSLGPPRKL